MIIQRRPVPKDPADCATDLVCAIVVQAVRDASAVGRLKRGEITKVHKYRERMDAPDWICNGGLRAALSAVGCEHLRPRILDGLGLSDGSGRLDPDLAIDRR